MDLVVNGFVTINKFKYSSKEIFKFMKFGNLEDYKSFTGFIKDKKVKGYICLRDNNIYKLEYLENE
jgi:hypothetical protein